MILYSASQWFLYFCWGVGEFLVSLTNPKPQLPRLGDWLRNGTHSGECYKAYFV